MSLKPGTRLGPYEILDAIGAGGMGEVYRARDARLGRDVAVKTLPAEVANHPDRLRRFEQEARAIAALSHPNLLAIFDVGHEGDVRFLVTELLEGETLRDRIERGPLDLEATVDLGRQLAGGVAAAHARGIIHRDLKPANIFLTREGFAKVLDFGLAKVLAGSAPAEEEDDRTSTAAGTVFGTPAYMAPEQQAGRNADERTDIFAIGAVLFEALSGKRALEAAPADTLSALLHGRPLDNGLSDTSLSGPIGGVVCRCLEKNPTDRFQSMNDLRAALEMLAGHHVIPAAPVDDASVAVLPFADLSADHSQAYFCEGMAEEIINALARVDGLRVAARTSTFQVKAQGHALAHIARTLNVRTALEGSVRTSGRRLRVTAQLVDARSSRAIWSDRYDGDAEDVFDIQDRIASAIVQALRVKLLGESQTPSPARQTSNLDAYHAYLKGRHHRLTTYDLLEACRAFTQAAELDPLYAPAHAGAAHTLVMLGHYGFIPPKDARARAVAAIDRALAVNPRLPQALAARAYVLLLFDRRWEDAEQTLNLALELDPNDIEARVFLAYLYVVLGRTDEAARRFAETRTLEPFSAWTRAATGMGLLHLGDFEGALEEARHALDARPDSLLAQAAFGAALTFLGRADEGIPVLEASVAAAPKHHWVRCWLGVAYGTAGRVAEAEGVMRALAERQLSSYVSPGWLALVPASLGRAEEALSLLDDEIKAGGSVPTFLRSPVIGKLRADPRYHDMLRRLRLPPI